MWFSSLTSCCLVVHQSPNGVLDQVQFLLTRCLILICFQSVYFISFHVPLFPIHRRNVCVHCVLCKHCLTKSISFGTVFIPISHYIRYTCIIPGSNPFCLQKYIYSSWQRFSTMLDALLSLVHVNMTAWLSCCRFLSFKSLERYSADCGDRLSTLNSSLCLTIKFEMIRAVWQGTLS